MMRPAAARCAAVLLVGLVGAGLDLMGCVPFALTDDYEHKHRGGDGGTGGDGGGPAPGCVPIEAAKDGRAVDSGCGVFVSASAAGAKDDNAGTQDAPVRSLAKAVALAAARDAPKAVYACAEAFDEAVHLPAGVALFGGLDCNDGWRWVGDETRTTLTAPAGTIPLRISSADSQGEVRVEDLDVVAAAIPSDDEAMRGTSSIAVLIDLVSLVDLRRCGLEAGDAARGADGEPFTKPVLQAADGNPGKSPCAMMDTVVDGEHSLPGGVSPRNDCGMAGSKDDDSVGGRGGVGGASDGASGADGSPSRMSQSGTGRGGAGQMGTTRCTDGTAGADGELGMPGGGATGTGTVSGDGYRGVAGSDGARGGTAQGGGGGGGSRGAPPDGGNPPRSCPSGTMVPPFGGASGGSGGAGGCGGAAGRGGGPGGASIALLSLNSSLRFEAVALKAGNGGNGGAGGLGQAGANGGAGAPGGVVPPGASSNLFPACAGGPGGKGGAGGPGGGGLGGHSLGIAYRGDEPPPTAGRTVQLGTPGQGGTALDAANHGAAGTKAETLAF